MSIPRDAERLRALVDGAYEIADEVGSEPSTKTAAALIRSSRLNALVALESTTRLERAAGVIAEATRNLELAQRAQVSAIERYEEAARQTGATVERWTRAQTVVAIVLAGVTLADVVMRVMGW